MSCPCTFPNSNNEVQKACLAHQSGCTRVGHLGSKAEFSLHEADRGQLPTASTFIVMSGIAVSSSLVRAFVGMHMGRVDRAVL